MHHTSKSLAQLRQRLQRAAPETSRCPRGKPAKCSAQHPLLAADSGTPVRDGGPTASTSGSAALNALLHTRGAQRRGMHKRSSSVSWYSSAASPSKLTTRALAAQQPASPGSSSSNSSSTVHSEAPAQAGSSTARPRRRAPAKADAAKMLTNAIANAATLEQLQALARAHEPSLDRIHAAALLMRAAQLATGPLMLTSAAAGGSSHALAVDGSADAAAAAAAGAVGPSGHAASSGGTGAPAAGAAAGAEAAIVTYLARIAAAHLHHFDAAATTSTLYALAKLGHADPALTTALTTAVPQLLPSFSGQQLATALWGAAKLRFSPPEPWLQQYLNATADAMEVGALSCQDLSLLLYALALMGRAPSMAWLGAWQREFARGFSGSSGSSSSSSSPASMAANAQDLSTALWALASLGAAPPGPWLQDALAAVRSKLSGFSSQGLSNVVWAMARLGVVPQAAWLNEYLAAVYERMGASVTPQAFSCTLASLAKLRAPLSSTWLSAMLGRSQPALEHFNPIELTNTAWALAQLGHTPPAPWLEAFFAAAAARRSSFSGQQAANVIWALALLKCAPPAAWLDAMLGRMQASLPELPTRQLTGVVWALASLGHVPPAAWLDGCLAQVFGRLLGSDRTAFANVLFCVASLDMEHLQGWIERYLDTGGGMLSLIKVAELARVLDALGNTDPARLRQAWVEFSDAEWSGDSGAPAGFEGMHSLSFQDMFPSSSTDKQTGPAPAPTSPGRQAAVSSGSHKLVTSKLLRRPHAPQSSAHATQL